jgi:(4-(4-[2-(gamma-L-glutamylamino)ethyl]phenoxymethyl)furan-2-yl)methanamine synthase
MTIAVLGLDIGGANLKAAHTDSTASTVAFALWKHPERLQDELTRLCAAMPAHKQLAVTMTGELCDCFASKREGVHAILQSVSEVAGRIPIRVWSTANRFLDVQEALDDPLCVAAANWLALGHLIAGRYPNENALLIDTGSTTTDILYLRRGVPEPRGLTDRDRLAAGELVYTGVRRTPICAVLGMEVAAEFFATMLDAYLLAGLVPENSADCDTADGRPATRACAHARLARMLCADAETLDLPQTLALAERAIRKQVDTVGHAIDRVLAGKPAPQRIVASGSGAVLAHLVCGPAKAALEMQSRLSICNVPRGTCAMTHFDEVFGPGLAEAACAYAVAMLATRE